MLLKSEALVEIGGGGKGGVPTADGGIKVTVEDLLGSA